MSPFCSSCLFETSFFIKNWPIFSRFKWINKRKMEQNYFYLFYKSSGIDSNFIIFEDPLQLIFWLFNSIASKYVVLSFPSFTFDIKLDVYSLIFSVTFQKKWRKIRGFVSHLVSSSILNVSYSYLSNVTIANVFYR